MKNYDEMSDMQIEFRVSAEKWKERCLKDKKWNNTAQRTYKEIQDGNCVYADARYCSSANDIMPIAIDNDIWYETRKIDNETDYKAVRISSDGQCNFKSVDKTMYRAIAICFLKMKDAENGKQ